MKPVLYRAKAINQDPERNHRTAYKNGDWVYGLLSRLDKFGAVMTNEQGVTGIEVDPETICEYTGVPDKNGIKIFEGDIVAIDSLFDAYAVKWDEEQCRFGRHRDGLYEQAGFNRPTMEFFEVVGNIYDNPGFLKEQE